MSNQHGPIVLKPISEIAKLIKNIIPVNIPDDYELKSIIKIIANEKNIRDGVIAYRDFLYLFCDRLISDGHLYVKFPKKPTSVTDYPFIHSITDLIADIGYYSQLSNSGDKLLITKIPSYTKTVDENGNKKNPKNSITMLIECMRFLSLCGFVFNGINLEEKKLNMSELKLEISYPNNPIMLIGLKALSIADIELRPKKYINDNNHVNLLRCDYRLLKAEDSDVLDLLKDFLQALPEKVQKLALELHQRYTDLGMTCVAQITTFEVHFSYAYIKNSKRALSAKDIYQLRTWEFALSIRYGYCLVVKSKKTDKYAYIIEKFPLYLKEKIARGYGCDRKLRNEHCQCGCQGIRIPLDESILNISKDIEIWLDNELSS